MILLAGGLVPAATTASGSRILLTDNGRLALIDPATGGRTDLGAGWTHDWSPDGSRIAFVEPPGRLWVMNVDGADRRQLAPSARKAGTPEWSPDGTKLAFVDQVSVDRSRPIAIVRTRLYVVGADGSRLRLVVAGAQPERPRWSPDGNRLLFHNRIRRATWALFVVDLRNSRVRRIAQPTHYFAVAEWSPDGTRISFVERGRRLNVVRADGTRRRRLSDLVVWGIHSWSPDGSRIAFESRRFLGGDIWSVAPDGTQLRQLSRGSEQSATDDSPDWSPDGAKLAFASNRGPRTSYRSELYVMNRDGSCESRLTSNTRIGPPAWRPGWPTGPPIRCHDLRVAAQVDVESDRVSRDADRVYLYEVDVINEGTERASDVRLRATSARSQAIFNSAHVAGGACEVAAEVSCNLGALGPGERRRIVARFRAGPVSGASTEMSAQATLAEPDAEPVGNATSVFRNLPFCRWTDVQERSVLGPPYGRGNLICGTDRADTIAGSAANEIVYAGRGGDLVSGGDGRDQIGGENGADRLMGGTGSDVVSGGSGDDWLQGGAGADSLSGGTGNDVIAARDGRRDYVWCDRGRDRVVADRADSVHGDCERVERR